MLSKKVKLKDSDFSGIKILLNGVSVQQVSTLEQALERAKQLDSEAIKFEYTKKDNFTIIVE